MHMALDRIKLEFTYQGNDDKRAKTVAMLFSISPPLVGDSVLLHNHLYVIADRLHEMELVQTGGLIGADVDAFQHKIVYRLAIPGAHG